LFGRVVASRNSISKRSDERTKLFGALAMAMSTIAGSAIAGVGDHALSDAFVRVADDDSGLVTPRLGEIINPAPAPRRGFAEITRIMMLGSGGGGALDTSAPRLAMSTGADLAPLSTFVSADTWRSSDIDTVVPRSEKPKPAASRADDSASMSAADEGTDTPKSRGRVIYKGTFDEIDTPEQIPEWRLADDTRAPLSTTPTGRKFLGELSNGGAKLAVQNVPLEGTIEVEFDVFAINAWDGNGGNNGVQDAWGVRVNGGVGVTQELFVTNFAAVGSGREERQAYPAPLGKGDYPAGTAATELNTLGYAWNGEPMDAVYTIKLSFKPTGDNVEIEFYGKNLQSDDGQAWGLDNVVIRSMPLGSGGGGGSNFSGTFTGFGALVSDNGRGLPDTYAPSLGNNSTPSTGGGGGGGGSPTPDTPSDVPAPASLLVLALGAVANRRRR